MTPQHYGKWTHIREEYIGNQILTPQRWIKGHQFLPDAIHLENGKYMGTVRMDIDKAPDDQGPYNVSGFVI